MNEERKPKKLNIKKIAVVALSVIMIMATFCLSAFADNPLTSKEEYVLGITEIPSIDPTYSNESEEYHADFITNNELEVTITFMDKNGNEFTSSGLILSAISDIVEIATKNEYNIIARYEKSYILDDWSLVINNEYTIIDGTDSDYGELNKEEAATIVTNAIDELVLNIPYVAMQDMTNAIKVTTTRSEGILSTFLGIGTWIGGAVSALIGMFYLNGSLTFIGYLTVAALAVSVVFLLVYLISSFLKFRG